MGFREKKVVKFDITCEMSLSFFPFFFFFFLVAPKSLGIVGTAMYVCVCV